MTELGMLLVMVLGPVLLIKKLAQISKAILPAPMLAVWSTAVQLKNLGTTGLEDWHVPSR